MHKQFTKEDRKTIEYYLRCHWKYKRIGELLERPVGTIRREVERNRCSDGIYRYGEAHKKYLARRKTAKQPQCKLPNDEGLRKKVEQGLRKLDSPEQIAGSLRRVGLVISHETIYQWIYGERSDLQCFLRCQKGQWRRKRGTKKREKKRRLQQFHPIAARPAVVDTRERLGDWEGDTVIGKNKKHRILTYVERKSGFACAEVLHEVSAPLIQDASVRLFTKIPRKKKKTLTFDRGLEFGGEDTLLEKRLHMDIFRANPYHSWERGTNENWNGLLRQFFPKGSEFDTVTQKDVLDAVKNLNHRPRKRLRFLSPHQVFVLGLDPNSAFHARM